MSTDFVLDDEQRIQKENAISFLTEYAKDTNRTYNVVAKKLNIPQSTAKNYLKRFIAAYHRGKQHGGEEWQRIVLALYNQDLANIGYPKEKLLKAHVIMQLMPIIERYDDFNVLENEKNITNNNNIQNNNSVSFGLDPFTDESGSDVNYDEDLYLADKLRSFTDSSNVTLLREVLRRIPTVPKNQIGNFIEMFKLNEDIYMRSPEAFKEFVRGFFGKSEYIAKMITDAFVNSVTKYGNAQAGFGVNPFTGMSSGQPSYYDFPGMVPMQNQGNMSDPRSMMLFEEMMYRRKQREEDEKLDREMQRHIRMSTMNMLNGISQNRQGGNGNDMMQYVLAGMLKPVMRIDETGKQVIEYVPNMGFGQNQPAQQGNDLTSILIGKMLDMNTAMITKSAEQPKYFETLLSTLLSKQIDRNPIEDVKNLISLKEQIAPAITGAPSQDQLNYQLKKEELNFHKDLELHKLTMEAKKQDHERAMQLKEAEKADNNTKEIMGGLSGLFKDIAQPILGQFLGGNKGGMTQEQLAALLQAQRVNSINQQSQVHNEEFDTRGGYTPDYLNPNSSNNLNAYLEKIRLDQNSANSQQIEMLKQQAAINQQEIIKMRENTAKQIIDNSPKAYSEKDYANLNDEQLSNVINNIDNMEKMLQQSRENAKKLLDSRNGGGIIKNAFDFEKEKEDNEITIPSNLDPDDVGVETVKEETPQETSNYDFSQINQVEHEKPEISINPDNISVTIN